MFRHLADYRKKLNDEGALLSGLIVSLVSAVPYVSTTTFGEKLEEQVEERLDFYDKGVLPHEGEEKAVEGSEKKKKKEKGKTEEKDVEEQEEEKSKKGKVVEEETTTDNDNIKKKKKRRKLRA
ncbi:hypothetical protein YC2023_106885 [Brassica napus]